MSKLRPSVSGCTLLILSAILILAPMSVFAANGLKYQTVDTSQFMRMMLHKNFTLIDVHIPSEGEIPGTDERLPFNHINQLQSQLPKDKNAPIVVYCMGSSMGSIAAQTLTQMGYTHVTQFYNGMIGWQEQGGKLIYKSK